MTDHPTDHPTDKQRRGRKIAMSPAELDAFLGEEYTCRVASVKRDGRPHVAPLWYVWDGKALWLNSIVASQRWTDLQHNPNISVVIDAGTEYFELRGAELSGHVAIVGEVPRVGEPNDVLTVPERLFAAKYSPGFVDDAGQPQMRYDKRHAWLRLVPERVVSWDFRKVNS
jgi:Pyridoxamine 5'-phosphate oxidase